MPSIVELLERLARLEARVVEVEGDNVRLRRENAVLRAENADLRARLGQDSSNSSRHRHPMGWPSRRRSRCGRGRVGGRVDSLVMRAAPCGRWLIRTSGSRTSRRGCGGCGDDLSGAVVAGVAVRQVFDLPDIGVRVAEHRIVSRRCRCGRVTAGRAPGGVDAPVQYGPSVNAAAVYLQQALFGAQARTAQAMADLFGVPMSRNAAGTASTPGR